MMGINSAETNPAGKAPELVVYYPNQRHDHGLLFAWVVMARNVWRARELIKELFKRDFLARYKKSFIGAFWIFLAPLAGILHWVFMQQTGLLQPGETEVPYPVYVLIGTTMWGLFMRLFIAAKEALRSGQEYMLQVNFPHEALLFKQTAQQLTDFAVAFGINIIVLFAFGVIPSAGIFLLPLVALPLFFLSASIGLIVAMVGIVAVDITRIINVGLGLLMFITPVIYSDKFDNPIVQTIAKWNPLTYLICSTRDIILYGRLYGPTGYFICAAGSIILFTLAWRVFYVSEHKLVERMI